MNDFERGKRAGLRMAMVAIAEWYDAADEDDRANATSWEIAQSCARAVQRKLKGEDPAKDDKLAGWPDESRPTRKRKP